MKKTPSLLIAFLTLLLASLACNGTASQPATPVCQTTQDPVQLDASTRPFSLGFTRWPPEATLEGTEHEFGFVINWTSIYFDKLLEIIPSKDARELSMIWVYTGLERSDGCQKQALAAWDAYLGLPQK